MDIADGPGVRVSIFMQGCAFNCPKCFNQETHDFAGGKEFTQGNHGNMGKKSAGQQC